MAGASSGPTGSTDGADATGAGPDARARRRRAAVAGHLGDVATARQHLDDPEPAVRASALAAVARAGGLEAAHLLRALADPEPGVRRRGLELVADLAGGGPAADVSILGLLEDPDDTVVEVAAWACGERDPAEPGAVPALCALVQEAPDPLVREAAVAALGSLGDPAALPTILRATEDRATVRRRAVLALAPFEGPEVEEALARAAGDRDWQVRQAAEDLSQH